MSKTVKATFRNYYGDTQPRMFLHHAAWSGGETREVPAEDAKALKDQFGEHFDFPKDTDKSGSEK